MIFFARGADFFRAGDVYSIWRKRGAFKEPLSYACVINEVTSRAGCGILSVRMVQETDLRPAFL